MLADDSSADLKQNGKPADICAMLGALQKTRAQAENSYATISNMIDNYATLQFGKPSKEVAKEWQMHVLDLKHSYSKELAILRNGNETVDSIIPNYMKKNNQKAPAISKQELSNEMQKIYTTLSILEKALTDVIDYRNEHKERLMHDLKDNAKFAAINDFFLLAREQLRFDLAETTLTMQNLGIELPMNFWSEGVSYVPASASHAIVHQWLLQQEHLLVMRYIVAMYKELLGYCSGAQ